MRTAILAVVALLVCASGCASNAETNYQIAGLDALHQRLQDLTAKVGEMAEGDSDLMPIWTELQDLTASAGSLLDNAERIAALIDMVLVARRGWTTEQDNVYEARGLFGPYRAPARNQTLDSPALADQQAPYTTPGEDMDSPTNRTLRHGRAAIHEELDSLPPPE